jgi:hypothetical protein
MSGSCLFRVPSSTVVVMTVLCEVSSAFIHVTLLNTNYNKYVTVCYRFCIEVNDFLSNIVLFDLIIFQILMCLPPLQLIFVSTHFIYF